MAEPAFLTLATDSGLVQAGPERKRVGTLQPCFFGNPAEDCLCGRCGARHQVEAFYLDVEVKESVSQDDLERVLKACIQEAMVSYRDDLGYEPALCGYYRQLGPGKGSYSAFVTSGGQCVATRLVRAVPDALRPLQPDGAAPATVDIAGYGLSLIHI